MKMNIYQNLRGAALNAYFIAKWKYLKAMIPSFCLKKVEK